MLDVLAVIVLGVILGALTIYALEQNVKAWEEIASWFKPKSSIDTAERKK